MSENKDLYINFDEYIRQSEPQKKERAEAWRVAIGLQAVDGLKISDYLLELVSALGKSSLSAIQTAKNAL